jgi:S-adenosylmethionine synthetase
MGFDAENCGILMVMGEQSPDIASVLILRRWEPGCGDQGLMLAML